MAHMLDFSKGFPAFTRREGSEPAWHKLGGTTPVGAPLEIWAKNGGLDFRIEYADIQYIIAQPEVGLRAAYHYDNRKVLYRADTRAPLGFVHPDYRVVQPMEILEFYRDLIATAGFQMETCGALCGGSKVWALARVADPIAIGGVDIINEYLLLATACDGSMATIGKKVKERVVCHNTWDRALAEGGMQMKVSHRKEFDADAMKEGLGLVIDEQDTVNEREQLEQLAQTAVTKEQVNDYIVTLFGDPEKKPEDQPNKRAMANVYHLFNGGARGSDLVTAKGTAWGLVNAVTEYVDHYARARNNDTRLNSAWFGAGEKVKQQAFEEALKLAA